MNIRTKLKLLGLTTLAGAALAYLLDPVMGPERRRHLVRRVTRSTKDVRDLATSVEEIATAIVPGTDSLSPVGAGEPAVAGVTDLSATA